MPATITAPPPVPPQYRMEIPERSQPSIPPQKEPIAQPYIPTSTERQRKVSAFQWILFWLASIVCVLAGLLGIFLVFVGLSMVFAPLPGTGPLETWLVLIASALLLIGAVVFWLQAFNRVRRIQRN